MEDDITASAVVPRDSLKGLCEDMQHNSVKLVDNCEYRLFQRPDEAIHRGYDKQAESDLSKPGSFLSNYEPLMQKDAKHLTEDAVHFDRYTSPIKNLISNFLKNPSCDYFVTSSQPRII